jgi:hypothetical protein
MSSRIKHIFLTGMPFGLLMALFWAFIIGWPLSLALVMGLAAGLLFGLAITAFIASPVVRESTRPTLQPAEHILYDGPANHFQGIEAVGGWLFLTNQRLIFKSHRLNIQNHEWSLPLGEIRQVQTARSLGIIPSGLRVQSRSGQSERFVIARSDEWIRRITAP